MDSRPAIGTVDRAGDHVLDRRYGRDVRLIAARGAHQIDHLFGRIDARKRNVAVRVGIGMAGHVAALGIAVVNGDIRNGDALVLAGCRRKRVGEGICDRARW